MKAIHYLFLVIFAATMAARTDAAERPKNVLFLIVDDLNTWLLSDANRYTGKVVAPNIQRLAQEGVLFRSAFSASASCVPSRTSFLSGVAPWKSGVYQNQAAVENTCEEEFGVILHYLSAFPKVDLFDIVLQVRSRRAAPARDIELQFHQQMLAYSSLFKNS